MVTGRRLVLCVAAASVGLALFSGLSAAAPGFISASSAASQSSSATLAISRPGSVTTGTVLVAAVAFRVSSTAPITPPAGWSQVVRTSCSQGTTVLSQSTFVKVATGAEPADYTFTTNTSTGGVASILAFTGVDTAQPVVASAGAFTRNTKGASPSITTTVGPTRLVGAYTHTGTALITAPTGMTSRSDAHTGGSAPTAALLTADEPLPSAGTYSRRPVTPANQVCNVGQLVALRSAPAGPTNTGAPTISGLPREGSLLTASQGSWSGSPTGYAYQWRRCDTGGGNCADIASASATSYLLTTNDVGSTIRVVVTASNAGGSASAASAPTGVVAASSPPSNQSPPAISGTAQEGATLSASTGTWSGSPTSYAYQWQRCDAGGSACGPLSGADESSYGVGSGDVGSTLRVVVTASNAGGSTGASSAATAVVASAPMPENQASPAISGTPQEGATLSASTGSWSGSPTGYAYQWRRCDTGGGNCADIASASATSYLLTTNDVGSTIRVVVTASNAGGSASAASAPTGVVAASSPPSNQSPPAISGTAQEGATLSASTGTWSGSPTSYAYQWQRCDAGGSACGPLSGADESSYGVGSGDVGSTLRVVVTASNAGGSTNAASTPTAIVTSAGPTNTSPPSVSGVAREGETLTANTGSWTGSPTSLTRQWERCNQAGGSCSALAGETGSTHVLGGADVGSTLRVVVTASDAGGSASAASAVTSVVLPLAPANLAPPTVSGVAQEGETLSASTGTWQSSSPVTYGYRWQRSVDGGGSWADIAAATNATYTLGTTDVGAVVRVAVAASNAGGSTSSTSTPTSVVVATLRPVNTVSPSMSGYVQVGRAIDATVGTWSGAPTGYAYQWQHSADGQAWSDVAGATASRYVIGSAILGRHIRVRVTATNAHGPTAVPSLSALVYSAGNLVALVNKTWQCSAAINLDLVKVTIWTLAADAVVFNTGCTGRIGRVEVDTWTGDAMKVTNASVNAAHDLVIESGYTSCFNRLPNAHQDGLQVMGGARITVRNFVWMCGNMADPTGAGVANAVLIARAGAGVTTPTDIVVDHSVLMPGASHTISLGVSLRSGVRDSVLCPDRTGSSPLTLTGAIDHIYASITAALLPDPRCASFASALAWAQAAP